MMAALDYQFNLCLTYPALLSKKNYIETNNNLLHDKSSLLFELGLPLYHVGLVLRICNMLLQETVHINHAAKT